MKKKQGKTKKNVDKRIEITEAELRAACEKLGLDLNDPGNLEWFRERLRFGFSQTTADIVQKIKKPRRKKPKTLH